MTPLALYIHWPYCKSKCPYCDFNSHVQDAVDHERWKVAYAQALIHTAQQTGPREVTSVFFGGGTPSLMPPDLVASVLTNIRTHWRVADTAEITLEANPTSAEAEKFLVFREAGINRLSIGVQSLREEALRFLGREHDVKTARQAIDMAMKTFDRVSFDLIYALPDQTLEDWRSDLTDALTMGPSHISLYQLTIEPGTAFSTRHQRGDLAIPDPDTAAGFYDLTQQVMGDAGLPAYEISNHARPGHESQHNLAYWRYQDYAGTGPGAHGRLTINHEKCATETHKAPDGWLKHVEETGENTRRVTPLNPGQRFFETLMMGLRLTEPLPKARLETEGAQPFDALVDRTRLNRLIKDGYLIETEQTLASTPQGRLCLHSVLLALLS